MGHINNAVYLTYMESARMAWWMQVTGRPGLRDIAMILARTEVDYRSPATYGDRLAVGGRCASIKRSSFVLESRVAEPEGARLGVEAPRVLVRYGQSRPRAPPSPEGLPARLPAHDPRRR